MFLYQKSAKFNEPFGRYKLKWSCSVAIDGPKEHSELKLQSPEPSIDLH